MALTALQKHIIKEIVSYVRRENLPVGSHLTELHLASVIGTSRTPIQAALAQLAKRHVLRKDPNRGYFLEARPESLSDMAAEWLTAAENPLYQKIADARFTRRLSDAINESELIRRFRVSRSVIRRTLSRIQEEGWVERRPGHGWFFLPMIDSADAYEESYAFRLAIEPAGILCSTFRSDHAALETSRRQQEFIVAGGYRTMSPMELFEANSRFHETIAACSGNRFILQAVRRLNQLRRLVEYRQAEKQRQPRKTHAQEHIEILDQIAKGDNLAAASLMRAHLEGARREKASVGKFEKFSD